MKTTKIFKIGVYDEADRLLEIIEVIAKGRTTAFNEARKKINYGMQILILKVL